MNASQPHNNADFMACRAAALPRGAGQAHQNRSVRKPPLGSAMRYPSALSARAPRPRPATLPA